MQKCMYVPFLKDFWVKLSLGVANSQSSKFTTTNATATACIILRGSYLFYFVFSYSCSHNIVSIGRFEFAIMGTNIVNELASHIYLLTRQGPVQVSEITAFSAAIFCSIETFRDFCGERLSIKNSAAVAAIYCVVIVAVVVVVVVVVFAAAVGLPTSF